MIGEKEDSGVMMRAERLAKFAESTAQSVNEQANAFLHTGLRQISREGHFAQVGTRLGVLSAKCRMKRTGSGGN